LKENYYFELIIQSAEY